MGLIYGGHLLFRILEFPLTPSLASKEDAALPGLSVASGHRGLWHSRGHWGWPGGGRCHGDHIWWASLCWSTRWCWVCIHLQKEWDIAKRKLRTWLLGSCLFLGWRLLPKVSNQKMYYHNGMQPNCPAHGHPWLWRCCLAVLGTWSPSNYSSGGKFHLQKCNQCV